MKRLTLDKPVGEMNMFELAHNCCYIENGKARYRDYATDMDCRDLTREIFKSYVKEELSASDEIFDEEIIVELGCGIDEHIAGMVAVFYRNLWAMAELREHLKVYEDLEAQGLLLRLPCKIGDTVYKIPSKTNYKLNIVNGLTENNRVYKQKVHSVQMWSNSSYLFRTCTGLDCVHSDFYKETWFLSKQEAEQALKEMEEEHGY